MNSILDKIVIEIDKGIKFSTLNTINHERAYPAEDIEEYEFVSSVEYDKHHGIKNGKFLIDSSICNDVPGGLVMVIKYLESVIGA